MFKQFLVKKEQGSIIYLNVFRYLNLYGLRFVLCIILVFSGVRVDLSLVFCVCFVDPCLSFCVFSFVIVFSVLL